MPSARCGQHPRPDDRNRRDSKIYDPSAVPEWARESIARIARDHPGSLAHWLAHVAEVEAAKRRSRFRFSMIGVAPGTELQLAKNPTIICTTVDDGNKVDYIGDITSLSDAALQAYNALGESWPSVSGPWAWTYKASASTI